MGFKFQLIMHVVLKIEVYLETYSITYYTINSFCYCYRSSFTKFQTKIEVLQAFGRLKLQFFSPYHT